MWQDILIAVGGFLFAVALIPTIMPNATRPPKSTSALTGGVLYSFTIAYASLGMWLAFSATIVTATMWAIILIQKWLNERHENLQQMP